ncbi:MAG: ABC transporter ATP-binding protein [Hyphomicrobiaceae bacterium]|nr:ABC transporter ATP-binding protein [Hyphomicrobiaceae bacterium]
MSYASLIPLLVSIGVVPASETGSAISGAFAGIAVAGGGWLQLEGVLLVFFAAIGLRSLLGYVSAVVSVHYVAGLVDHLRRRVYVAFSRASWLYLTTASHATQTHALTDLVERVGSVVLSFIMFGSALVMMAAGIAMAFLVSPMLTATITGVVVLLAIPTGLLHASGFRHGKSSLEAMQRLYESLGSRMSGVKLAKAFGIECVLENDFGQISDRYRHSVVAIGENSARLKLLQDLAGAAALAILVYVGIRVIAVPSMEVVLLIVISARLLPLVTTVQTTLRTLVGLLPAYNSLHQQETSARIVAEAPAVQGQRISVGSSIELRDVSFSYPQSSHGPVLRRVSLTIPARSVFAIMGVSGSGKSTLADIIAGLLVPDEGELLIDGTPISAARRAGWRGGVAYVPQDASLFHDTIRANLIVGAREATEEEIWHSLECVQAGSLVRAQPEGLNTIVGERGARLSGGQRQRLRLASAVLRKPELLVLDEATNALSPGDEIGIIAKLQRELETTTVVVIAHRESSLRWASAAVLLSQGTVVTSGTTEEVLASYNSLFREF